MPRRPPQLRQHHSGVYFVRYGGRDHILYADYQKSLGEYPEHLARWAQLQQQKQSARAPSRQAFRVIDLHEKWLASILADLGQEGEKFYRLHTQRFLHAFADLLVKDVGPAHLQELKVDLVDEGLAPKTIKHNLDAVKRMFRWGADMGLCPEISFRAVKTPPQKPPSPEPLDLEGVKAMVAAGEAAYPALGPWLRLNYLCFLRVVEVPRLIFRQGKFIEEGIFQLEKSKMEARTQIPRRVVLTPRAMEVLEKAEREWDTASGYYKAVVRACGNGGPHVLRDSAASHLLEKLGPEGLESVQWLLGHISGGAWRHYGKVPWQRLRTTAAQLEL